MAKINLSDEEKLKLIEAVNKGVEPSPDLLPKLFPGMAEKFDVKALDRAKIPILEYAGKRSKAAILAEAGAGIGAAPLQIVRFFGEAKNGEWKNLIVQGDNLQFLKTCYKNVDPLIKDKVKGKVKLFYNDPPFATKADFQSKDGATSYSDKIESAEFLEDLRERLIFMRETLAEDGSIYLHLDWKKYHYVKVLMDDIFGTSNFRNEIIWYYTNKLGTGGNTFDSHHDSLLVYVRSNQWVHHPIYQPVKKRKMQPVTQKINGERVWLRDDDGSLKYAMGAAERKVGDVWEIPYINPVSTERIDFPTQKPEALLERIILASSNPGDLVMDIFGGSGTTAAVAEKLDRRWITCDFGKHAIYTMQKRILNIAESKRLGTKEIDEESRCEKCNSVIEESANYKKCSVCQCLVKKENKPIKEKKYDKEPKLFCVISSGAYDFSHIMDLRKHKETYIDFVLGLFQLARDEEKADKYKLANIYAVKDNNPVEVYPIWDDQFLKEVKIDETYLRGIITQSGGKLKGDYYIITPESCTNVGDTTLKNQDGKNIHFQMLTFPYKVLEDVSRNLALQEQPSSQANVNTLITSTAYYFNEDVEITATRTSDGLKITKFETKILNKEGKRFEGFSGLAMLLVDLDYEAGKPFDMDKTVFAKEIAEDGSMKIEGLTKRVGLIAIDKHGNESKPFNLK